MTASLRNGSRCSDKRVRRVGEVVRVVPEPAEAHVFAVDSGDRLVPA